MFSIIKRILRLSGKYRPRVIAGLIFNALKSCCAAFVFFAVLLVMLNIEHLTETVILQAFGIVALSVLGRFLFQYLSDVLMSASGYEIFREKRLEIGNQLKRAPMGYFTENNLGTVQTVYRKQKRISSKGFDRHSSFIFVRTCYLYHLCVPIFFSLHDVSGKSIVVIIGSYYIFPCSS